MLTAEEIIRLGVEMRAESERLLAASFGTEEDFERLVELETRFDAAAAEYLAALPEGLGK